MNVHPGDGPRGFGDRLGRRGRMRFGAPRRLESVHCLRVTSGPPGVSGIVISCGRCRSRRSNSVTAPRRPGSSRCRRFGGDSFGHGRCVSRSRPAVGSCIGRRHCRQADDQAAHTQGECQRPNPADVMRGARQWDQHPSTRAVLNDSNRAYSGPMPTASERHRTSRGTAADLGRSGVTMPDITTRGCMFRARPAVEGVQR